MFNTLSNLFLQTYDTVLESVGQNQGNMFFLDAPGGTGKTFVTTSILAEVRKQGKIAIAVASPGIGATLLPGSKSAHAMFKIPIDLESAESPVCGLSRNSVKGHVLKDCSLIVWDDCTIANRKVIEAVDKILTGCGVGEAVFIPRIPLIPHNFPFQFKRVQFPVSVCFAMTINKSQEQTLRAAGVDHRTSCFSHGQLYVACSRITSPDSPYILAPGSITTNVVYREVL